MNGDVRIELFGRRQHLVDQGCEKCIAGEFAVAVSNEATTDDFGFTFEFFKHLFGFVLEPGGLNAILGNHLVRERLHVAEHR